MLRLDSMLDVDHAARGAFTQLSESIPLVCFASREIASNCGTTAGVIHYDTTADFCTCRAPRHAALARSGLVCRRQSTNRLHISPPTLHAKVEAGSISFNAVHWEAVVRRLKNVDMAGLGNLFRLSSSIRVGAEVSA